MENCEHNWVIKTLTPADNDGNRIFVSGVFNLHECEKCGMRQSEYDRMVAEGLWESKEIDATINYGSRKKRIQLIIDMIAKYNLKGEFYKSGEYEDDDY